MPRMGIAHDHFELVKDEAISGTQDSRPGYDQLKELILSGRLGKPVVTEQSRLTRGDNAKSTSRTSSSMADGSFRREDRHREEGLADAGRLHGDPPQPQQ